MLIVCWQYTGASLGLRKLSVSVHLPLPTGPGQSWGKQGSQVVHWQAAPNRPSSVCLLRGGWESLGWSSAIFSSPGLWKLLPSQTIGPHSGVSSQEGALPRLPQGPQALEKCDGRCSAGLPALCPGLFLLTLLPASGSLSAS